MKKSLKLLLDENLPKRLKEALSPHEVFTVRDMDWNGITNGEFLKLMIEKELMPSLRSIRISDSSKILGNIRFPL